MTNILLSGYLGRMGKVVAEMAAARDDMKVVAGVDVEAKEGFDFPTFACFKCAAKAFEEGSAEKPDVIIDFSNPKALKGLLFFATTHKVPAILCTTGYSDEQLDLIEDAAKEVPMFRSGNMSVGINLISELAKRAAEILYPGFDVEILEAHHNQKLDAPSGTALMLGEAVKEGIEERMEYEFDRHSKRGKRPANEIGMSSIRGGTIVGEHEVIFAGPDEVIKITHSAYSRSIFANGALNAARWMTSETRAPGMYSMKDVLA